ncbi:MAG TPA: hypothetical protein VH301_04605 [Usitatibacter sp.]|jgi:hypothetical protein|nr:hypothetical protein [Usitatibacter sp.]
MGLRSFAALIAAAAPLALFAQAPASATPDTPDLPRVVQPQKLDTTGKAAPAKKHAAKKQQAPKKPAAPKPPKPPAEPKKPSNVPTAIYDRQGNAIPTSPDAYDVSSAKKR